MPNAVGIWSIAVPPGEPTVFTPLADLRITSIALGDELDDQTGRTTVKLVYRPPGADEEDEEDEAETNASFVTAVLGSLTPGKIEQSTVDLVLMEDEEYLFEVIGKNTIYLHGNYIDQTPFDQDPYGSDEESEDDFDLRDVSSDVEIDPDELADLPSEEEGRFEEIKESPKGDSKKRRRESDAMETDEQEPKLSKSQQKKLNKKLKGADGVPVPPAQVEEPKKATETKKDKQDKSEKKDKKKDEKKDEKPKGETKTLGGGVKVVDHKVGSGPQAKKGDTVSMRYIGKLDNGKIFDQNTKGAPFKFRLGAGEVIKGWDIGIVGMQPGGERLLTIPAPMAYGKRKQNGIPANSTLIFEVKLVGIN